MKKHWLLTTLLAIALCVICFTLFPTDVKAASVDDLRFTLNSDGESYAVSARSTSVSGELVIPETYNEKPVTRINNSAFLSCRRLTSITIPDSVTYIGSWAFQDCTGLTEITIPDSVTTISMYAFRGCSNLESITTPCAWNSYPFGYIFGNDKYTGGVSTKQYANSLGEEDNRNHIYFYIPSSLKTVTVTSGKIPYGAFSNCTGLTSITIGDSITSIGKYAFEGCTGLTEIAIPDSVTSIGRDAFQDCSNLTDVYVTDIGAWSQISFGSYSANPLEYADNFYINGELARTIEIPNGVSRIGDYAFYGCTGLTSITIPDSVTRIDLWAFADCTGLTEITIPDSVSSIGDSTFYNCDSLTSITIPDSVSSIGNSAFCNCDSLTSITIPNSVSSIGNSAFYNCDSLTGITIPDSLTSIGDYAFKGCDSLTSITIPDSLTSIGYSAFKDCSSLMNVYYAGSHNQWNEISVSEGNSPLSQASVHCAINCNNGHSYKATTTKATLSKNGSIVKKCTVCDNVESKTTIHRVKSVELSETSYVYDGKVKTPTVTVKNSAGKTLKKDTDYAVTYEGGRKTAGTYEVTVKLKGNYSGTIELTFEILPQIAIDMFTFTLNSDGESYTLSECDPAAIGFATIPDTYNGKPITRVDDHAFQNCAEMTGVSIGNNVFWIGDCAFQSCTGLSSVTIGNRVTNISFYAFQNCQNLTALTIPGSMRFIGDYAFHWCANLTDVYYAGSRNQWDEIGVGVFNESLTAANIHFGSTGRTSITTQPKTAKVKVGATAKFTVKASGEGLKYQWQSSGDGKTWKNCSSSTAKKATFTFTAKTSHSSNYYRCVITDSDGNKVYTDAIRLYVLSVTSQPKTQKVEAGEKVKFTVTATGAGKTYQWQSSADGKTWKNCSSSSATSATFSFTSKTSHSGNYYRCRIKDNAGNTVYTDAVRLYVLGITEQPDSKTVTKGKTAKFTVEATGASKIYQWQYSTDGGKTWKNITSTASAKKATLSFTTKTSHNGNYYRCRIKDSGGNTIYTNKVKLTVKK